ncbi:MAG: disulfide bond formation protein B [Rickettsiales bacterium]
MHKYYRIFFNLILGASVFALGLAYILEYAYELQPCHFCYYQRWIYYGVASTCIVGLLSNFLITTRFGIMTRVVDRFISYIIVLLIFCNMSMGFMHLSSEKRWFHFSTSCTSTDMGFSKAETLDQFRDLMLKREVVSCDHVQWTLFRISLAGWNFIYSAVLFVFSLIFSICFTRNIRYEEDTK